MISRFLTSLQNFFAVSPKEARGIVVLLLISVLCLIFPVFLKEWLLSRSPAERDWERQQIDSIVTELIRTKEAGSSHTKIAKQEPVNLLPFDPNNATVEELQAVGVPAGLAQRIVNYREKGGGFRKKEDLKRIYGFPIAQYERLEPFIIVAEQSPTSRAFSQDRPEGKRKEGTTDRVSSFRSDRPNQVIVPFDINKADSTQLMRLKGIGASRARTIIRYRDALGGFYSEKQYSEIFNLDSVALTQLQQYAKVLSAHKKIKINDASEEDLLKHPYGRKNSRNARAVVRYREQHGPYNSLDQLYEIVSIEPAFLDMFKPYLQL